MDIKNLDRSNLQEKINALTDEEAELLLSFVEEEWHQSLAEKARVFNVDGFAAFHELIFGLPLLPHMRIAITQIMDSWKNKRSTAIEIFRGAAKTTTVTIGFGLFLIGHNTTKSGIVIQVQEESAKDNTLAMATHIEFNKGWKMAFPHIVPDKGRGWSARGYELMYTHTDYTLEKKLDYGDWLRMKGGDKDPTFFGVGYKSGTIIGRRPFWLLIDDINDEKNTMSGRECDKVNKLLTGTLFPAANHGEWKIIIGTPWTEDDALHYCVETELFDHIKIPVYKEVDGKKIYTWPDVFDEEKLEMKYKESGQVEFARMYLLDLEAAKGIWLKAEWLVTYNQEAGEDWAVNMGVDYASTPDRLRNSRRDEFAIATGKIIPSGGLILTGGYSGELSESDTRKKMAQYASLFPTLRLIGTEMNGKGEEFYEYMIANTGLPMLGQWVSKSKGQRFQRELAPLFETGKIWMCKGWQDIPFLVKFYKQWISFDGTQTTNDDTIDAVYHLAKASMGFLLSKNDNMSADGSITNHMLRFLKDKKKNNHPYSSLSRR